MKIVRRLYSTLLLTAWLSGAAAALPEGANITHGAVNISTNGSTQTITQSSQQAIINWNGFNINVGELVHFVQPSTVSAILNRVVGQDPSRILGAMRANGQVFLINPNGVVFGESANIDVGSLVVSTLNMTDEDFLQGNLRFEQAADKDLAAVINHGTIKVSDEGFLVLTGPMVANEGVILAKVGQVALAAGTKSTISFDPTGLIQVQLPEGSASEDGIVSLNHSDVSDVLSGVVRTSAVPAGQIVERDGRTFLEVASGTVVNTGRISADGLEGLGGGRIILDSTSNTLLAEGSSLSAKGQGADSAGGVVEVLSGENLVAEAGSLVDVQGGSKGSGGKVEYSGRSGSFEGTVKVGEEGTFLLDPFRIVVGSSGSAPVGSMFVAESAIEAFDRGTFILQADRGVDFEPLVDGSLTLQNQINLTIDLILPDGSGSAISFDNPGDTIDLAGGGSFTYNSVTGTDVNDLKVNTESGSISLNFTNGGSIAGESSFFSDSSFITITGAENIGSLSAPVQINTDIGATATGDIFLESVGRVGLGTTTAENFTGTGTGFEVFSDVDFNNSATFNVSDRVEGGGRIIAPTLSITADNIGGIEQDLELQSDDITLVGNDIKVDIRGGDPSRVHVTNTSAQAFDDTLVLLGGEVPLLEDLRRPDQMEGVLSTVFTEGPEGSDGTEVTYVTSGDKVLDGIFAGNFTMVTSGGPSNHITGTIDSAENLSLTGDTVDVVIDGVGNFNEINLNATAGDVTVDDQGFIHRDFTGSATGDFSIESTDQIRVGDITAQNVNLTLLPSGREGPFLGTIFNASGTTVTAQNQITATTAVIGIDADAPLLQVTNPQGSLTIERATNTGDIVFQSQGGSVGQVGEGEIPPITGASVTAGGTDVFLFVDTPSFTGTATTGNLFVSGQSTSPMTVNASAANNILVDNQGDLVHQDIDGMNVDLTSRDGDITTDSGRVSAVTEIVLTGNNITAETESPAIDALAPGNITISNFSENVSSASIDAGGDASFTSVGTATLDLFQGANLALDLGQAITGSYTGGRVSLAGTSIDATVTANQVSATARNGDAIISSSETGQLTVSGSSAAGDFQLDHGGDVQFDQIEAQNVTINAGGDIVDTANTIIASGITLSGNNVLVNTQGQVIVISAQGDVTVSNTLVDVTSLSIDAQGTVTFGTEGDLTIAQVAGGPLVDLSAGANIFAETDAFVSATDVVLAAGGSITPDLDAPLDVQASNTITVTAPGAGTQGQGGTLPTNIAASLKGSIPAQSVTVGSGSGPVYYNGILLNGTPPPDPTPDPVPDPPVTPPEVPPQVVPNEVIDQIGQQNGQVVDDGSVGSAANDGLVEESPTQQLVAQLTEAAEGAGGEGLSTETLITFEVDELGEVKVALSQPSPYDEAIDNSEDMTADDIIDLDTEELNDVKVTLYYDAANDQLLMAVDLRADDILDLDLSGYEEIPVNLNYNFLSDPAIVAEALRADDILDLHVEALGNIPIKIHVEGDVQ